MKRKLLISTLLCLSVGTITACGALLGMAAGWNAEAAPKLRPPFEAGDYAKVPVGMIPEWRGREGSASAGYVLVRVIGRSGQKYDIEVPDPRWTGSSPRLVKYGGVSESSFLNEEAAGQQAQAQASAADEARLSDEWNDTTPPKIVPPYQVGDFIQVQAGRGVVNGKYGRGRIVAIQGDVYVVQTLNYRSGGRPVLDKWQVKLANIYDDNVAKQLAAEEALRQEMAKAIRADRAESEALDRACGAVKCHPAVTPWSSYQVTDLAVWLKVLAKVDGICKSQFPNPPPDKPNFRGEFTFDGSPKSWCALAARHKEVGVEIARNGAQKAIEAELEGLADNGNRKVEALPTCSEGKYLSINLKSREEQAKADAELATEVKGWFAAAGAPVSAEITEGLAQLPKKRQAAIDALLPKVPATGKCGADAFCKKWSGEFQDDDFPQTVTAFGDEDWGILKNELGVPREKGRNCWKLVKKPGGLCKWIAFGVYADYAGGGKYGNPAINYQTLEELGLAKCP